MTPRPRNGLIPRLPSTLHQRTDLIGIHRISKQGRELVELDLLTHSRVRVGVHAGIDDALVGVSALRLENMLHAGFESDG